MYYLCTSVMYLHVECVWTITPDVSGPPVWTLPAPPWWGGPPASGTASTVHTQAQPERVPASVFISQILPWAYLLLWLRAPATGFCVLAVLRPSPWEPRLGCCPVRPWGESEPLQGAPTDKSSISCPWAFAGACSCTPGPGSRQAAPGRFPEGPLPPFPAASASCSSKFAGKAGPILGLSWADRVSKPPLSPSHDLLP